MIGTKQLRLGALKSNAFDFERSVDAGSWNSPTKSVRCSYSRRLSKNRCDDHLQKAPFQAIFPYNVFVPEELLQTKLYIQPLRPNLVSRPRLIERLNHGLVQGHKLTLVSAPAGFGKSTLLSAWVQGDDMRPRATWFSLDEADNDLTRFLTYFVAALETVENNVGKGTLIALQSSGAGNVEMVLTTLLNEITEFPDDVVLILDDYHVIESRQIDEALTFLLEHLPPKLHLVIASRIDPSLPLSRLRARGQMTEIRVDDLRFTPDEAADFLNQVMGFDLSAQDIEALELRTEGWIAGLQLAAISMRGLKRRGEIIDFIKSFSGSHRYIQDYLADEVLQQQSKVTKDFLLQTSILSRFSAQLCDAVTDTNDSQAILESLEASNLFIVPLDNERRWFRYHHLFADLLLQRLRENEPDRIPNLHHRAGGWFAKQGLNREAINHSLAAKDYQRATDLIRSLALEVLQSGEHATVAGWINALPESLVREQPYLCVLHAWALQLTGQFEATEARLSDAEHALANPNQENDADEYTIRGYIHSHRAYLTFIRGEHARTIGFARQALEQLPLDATVIRTQTALYLGVAYRTQGELKAALDIFTEAVATSQKIGGSITGVLSFLNLAELYIEQARLHQAKSIYEQALQFTNRYTGRPDMPFAGYAYVGIGRILRQWNDLDNAYRHTARGIALCRDWNVAEMLALSCIEMANIQHALGNDKRAREALQEAKGIFDGFSPWGSSRVAAHQAQLDLARGEVASAERWAQANELNQDDELELHRDVEYLTLARVFMAQDQFEQALSILGRLQQITQAIGKIQSVLKILVLQMAALSAQGHTEQALTKLDQALIIGEAENYVRVFVDEGQPISKLLRQAAARSLAPTYVRILLAAFGAETKEERQTSKSPPLSIPPDTSLLVDPLSERESEVLQLVAKGLSNREISERLFLALDTVKGHNRRIYRKLGVKNRTQAINKAVSLKIIPPQ